MVGEDKSRIISKKGVGVYDQPWAVHNHEGSQLFDRTEVGLILNKGKVIFATVLNILEHVRGTAGHCNQRKSVLFTH